MQKNKLSVLLVDDHPIFSKGLSALIQTEQGYHVVAEAKNGAEALARLIEKDPDFAIVDLNLGDEDGLEVIRAMKARKPNLKVLVLSMYDERYYSERALKAGAMGYVMKEEATCKVLEAMSTIVDGNIYLSESEKLHLQDTLDGKTLEDETQFASINQLSNRQLQVFSLIGQGFGTIEIAEKLDVSTKTVDAHKEHIKQKLHCPNSLELRRLAVLWAAQAQ